MNATFTGKEQAIAIKNIKREEHNRKNQASSPLDWKENTIFASF